MLKPRAAGVKDIKAPFLGVGHDSFADYRPSYNAEASADAWKRCTDHFAKALKA